MILALYDFLKYSLKIGKYSDGAVRAKGFWPALPNVFDPSRVNELRPADLIFYHGAKSLCSWAVMYYTTSQVSHVAMYYGNGDILDVTTSGVIIRPLYDYFDGGGYLMIASPRIADVERSKIVEHAAKHVGESFGWLRILEIWYSIVTAKHKKFRFRFVIDNAVLFGLILIVSQRFMPLFILTLCLGLSYAIILVYHLLRQTRLM